MPSWDAGTPLRAWLRKAPKPARIRVRTVDADERMVELTSDLRGRWKAAEEAVLAMRAESVECLDDKGAVLRARRLETDEEGDEPVGADARSIERAVSRERRELAGVLDAYGKQLNSSFQAGANAANTGQEHLAALVETLTTNLSHAIVGMHNMAANLANVLIQHANEAGGDDDKQDKNSQALMGLIAGAMGARQPAPAAPPNGKRDKP